MDTNSGGAAGAGEEFAVGCILSIKTTLGDEFDAQVIAFDRPSNILVLHILSDYFNLIVLFPPMYSLLKP
ncbi:hypothetical protein RHGRI_033509 [Rhododendron griersonianum]|uniref:LSM12 LSM domain-containing protein n=1 Tax=Rhododendron griersonianum TaxID=479676 RepID=A0AAV6I0U6_9ERIC|nr:hypothetical protein RHGRI_033509 [Rhododendron griersonianum]